jgi:hypothetical protein
MDHVLRAYKFPKAKEVGFHEQDVDGVDLDEVWEKLHEKRREFFNATLEWAHSHQSLFVDYMAEVSRETYREPEAEVGVELTTMMRENATLQQKVAMLKDKYMEMRKKYVKERYRNQDDEHAMRFLSQEREALLERCTHFKWENRELTRRCQELVEVNDALVEELEDVLDVESGDMLDMVEAAELLMGLNKTDPLCTPTKRPRYSNKL